MSVHDIGLFSLVPVPSSDPIAFADPEWRGFPVEPAVEGRLRPFSDIQLQIARLSASVMGLVLPARRPPISRLIGNRSPKWSARPSITGANP